MGCTFEHVPRLDLTSRDAILVYLPRLVRHCNHGEFDRSTILFLSCQVFLASLLVCQAGMTFIQAPSPLYSFLPLLAQLRRLFNTTTRRKLSRSRNGFRLLNQNGQHHGYHKPSLATSHPYLKRARSTQYGSTKQEPSSRYVCYSRRLARRQFHMSLAMVHVAGSLEHREQRSYRRPQSHDQRCVRNSSSRRRFFILPRRANSHTSSS